MNEDIKSSFAQPLKVLLVDDDRGDLKLLQSMLDKSDTKVKKCLQAASLAEAMQILAKEEIDVVVLDLNLPDSNGVETLVQLNDKYPAAAVVVNTGAYEDDLGLKTMSMGAQDFIVKGKYKAYGLVKAIHYAKERKRFELELQTAYLRLQEAQAHLIQAEKLNVIGRLASGVAHEVKNPLATILFGVTYLHERLEKEKDDKIQLTLRSIKDSASRANNIITDLLDFSSLSKLNKKPEDVNVIVEKSLSLTQHQITKQCIRVDKKLEDKIPTVNVDINRLEQVLVNLILNAINAMSEGGELKTTTYVKVVGDKKDSKTNGKFSDFEKGSTLVLIEIEDNGSGIPKDKMDKIFDPFFTTRRTGGGVGLGLSVAKNIIEMHNGKLFIENSGKKGARATLILQAA